MVIPILMHFCSFDVKLERCKVSKGAKIKNLYNQVHLTQDTSKSYKAAHHQLKCGVNNDIKLFPTLYHRIYWRNFLKLSNKMSHYKIKCIRMLYLSYFFCNKQTNLQRFCCFVKIPVYGCPVYRWLMLFTLPTFQE